MALRIDDRDARLLDVLANGASEPKRMVITVGVSSAIISHKLSKLERLGMVRHVDKFEWAITDKGQRARQAIRAEITLPAWERVWSTFAERNGLE